MIRAHILLMRVAVAVAMLAAAYTGATPLFADDTSLSVTVTPPLYQLTIGPGESWTTTLKIVNSNAYDVAFYAQVLDMQASGENGTSKFIPVIQQAPDPATKSFALAHWIQISSAPIPVPAGGSVDVPFTVTVPQNAEPGGHYGAILVGTQPANLNATGTLLKISSYVSSLLFVKIKGDVTESGRIREFLTAQQLYQTPKADFLLRFENTGNVHLHPEGEITIYNMWGKQRGDLPINQDTDFGNVLPDSVRRFQFSWEGDRDPFDIGLYSAVVTLAYGEDGKHNVTGTTYFWVVPVVPVSVGLGTLLVFILLITWFIRRYIRRALALEQARRGLPVSSAAHVTREALLEPIKEGVIDLRGLMGKKGMPLPTSSTVTNTPTTRQFLRKYRLFGAFIVLFVVGFAVLWVYFGKVLAGTKGFQITDVHIEEEPTGATTQ